LSFRRLLRQLGIGVVLIFFGLVDDRANASTHGGAYGTGNHQPGRSARGRAFRHIRSASGKKRET